MDEFEQRVADEVARQDAAKPDPNPIIAAILADQPEHAVHWTRVVDLLAAFHSLAQHEPKIAATLLGKAHKSAVEWSKLVDPKGED